MSRVLRNVTSYNNQKQGKKNGVVDNDQAVFDSIARSTFEKLGVAYGTAFTSTVTGFMWSGNRGYTQFVSFFRFVITPACPAA